MGTISRKVMMPVCESLCFFCPALRARSRHPVKRYKKLLADIFPRSQVSFLFPSYFFRKNCHLFSYDCLEISSVEAYLFIYIKLVVLVMTKSS